MRTMPFFEQNSDIVAFKLAALPIELYIFVHLNLENEFVTSTMPRWKVSQYNLSNGYLWYVLLLNKFYIVVYDRSCMAVGLDVQRSRGS
eukprot:maker-scaffold_85-snap-gene-0.40-mRNA-1 protein AED:0.36 eAED:0.41 QI:0/0.66/0.57/1/0/0/7/284/88